MLPGLRVLFATVLMSVSLLVFGLGAAALLRAAHETFASQQTWLAASGDGSNQLSTPQFSAPLASSEQPPPSLAMLRVDPPFVRLDRPPPPERSAALTAPPEAPSAADPPEARAGLSTEGMTLESDVTTTAATPAVPSESQAPDETTSDRSSAPTQNVTQAVPGNGVPATAVGSNTQTPDTAPPAAIASKADTLASPERDSSTQDQGTEVTQTGAVETLQADKSPPASASTVDQNSPPQVARLQDTAGSIARAEDRDGPVAVTSADAQTTAPAEVATQPIPTTPKTTTPKTTTPKPSGEPASSGELVSPEELALAPSESISSNSAGSASVPQSASDSTATPEAKQVIASMEPAIAQKDVRIPRTRIDPAVLRASRLQRLRLLQQQRRARIKVHARRRASVVHPARQPLTPPQQPAFADPFAFPAAR
jgi:hypothetical protein